MRAIGLAAILWIIALLAAGVACGGDPPRSVSETASPEGVTWVLQTLYGEPVLDGTFVWLRLDGDEYGGLDGCNRYGGMNQHGTPVDGDEGEFNPPPTSWTDALCEAPAGVMEQADEYRTLLGRQGQSLRVDGDRLEILDWAEEVGLVFVRQVPLAGQPVELPGTEWQLMLQDSEGGDGKAATLAFVDDHLAVGTTACRGYAAFYRVSDGRVGFPATSMTEYGTSSCAEESRRQEGQFTNDLSQAIEYSVSDEDGTGRLRIRTSRGRTVTFEPLAGGVESVFAVGWTLAAFVTVGKWGDPDAPLLRVDRLIPGTEVTARFHIGRGVSGFGGCNPYGAKLEPEEPFTREDGTLAIGLMAITSRAKDCPDPPEVKEQQQRFTGLISNFERYRIYGELLVIHTNEDVVLLFREG